MWRTSGTKIGVACFIFLIVLVLALIQPAYSTGLAVDGSGSSICAGPSCTSSAFSTSNANDVIVVFAVSTPAPFSGVPTASGLSFAVRLSTPFAGSFVGEWWAPAPTALVAEKVTAHTTSSFTAIGLVVWGISGANTAIPFDPSLSSPATNSGATPLCTTVCSVPISVTIPSTSNPNDMILGMAGDEGSPDSFAAGSGFALISALTANAAAEFKVVSSAQSSLSVPMTLIIAPGITHWVMFGDAVQAAAPTPPIPEYPYGLPALALLALTAYAMIRRGTRTKIPQGNRFFATTRT